MDPIIKNSFSFSCLLIDFGGVIAEEGFYHGLVAIALKFGKEPESFFRMAADIVYNCGYVTGQASEHDFWQEVRKQSGIDANDLILSEHILSRFIPRPGMLQLLAALRQKGITVCLLSDQSDWLDRLNGSHNFFHYFDRVFNSYHLGKSKKDPSIFSDVLNTVHHPPSATLFVDDHLGHIERTQKCGLLTHHFIDEKTFRSFLGNNNRL